MGLILFFPVEAGVGATEAGGDPPVDVTHLVTGLIETKLPEMEAGLAPDTPLGRLMNASTLALARPEAHRQQPLEGEGDVGVIPGLGDGGHGDRAACGGRLRGMEWHPAAG